MKICSRPRHPTGSLPHAGRNSETRVSWSLGEHFFATAQAAQINSILAGAAAHHVTVVATSGDNGPFSDAWFGGTPVKEVSLPASDPLVLAVGGTQVLLGVSAM